MQHQNPGQAETPQEDFAMLVRQISIDKLQEENKKLGPNFKNPAAPVQKNPSEALCNIFMKTLLKPKDYQAMKPGGPFPCKKEHILELVNECLLIV